jgi:hypothetical protein
MDRQRHHRGRGGGLGARRRRRRGEGLPGREGDGGLRRPSDRAEGVASRGVAGGDRADGRPHSGREQAARSQLLQGRRTGPGGHTQQLRLDGARPCRGRLRRGAHVRQAAAPVRTSPLQLSDRPGTAGADAVRSDRHAATASRPRAWRPRGGYCPRSRASPSCTTRARRARSWPRLGTCSAATASCWTSRSSGTWRTWRPSTLSRGRRPSRRSSWGGTLPGSAPSSEAAGGRSPALPEGGQEEMR